MFSSFPILQKVLTKPTSAHSVQFYMLDILWYIYFLSDSIGLDHACPTKQNVLL